MKVLVTGAAGMVGQALSDHCRSLGDSLFPYDHAGLDISDSDRVMHSLKKDRPDVVINCAAWTDVDGCESKKERAFAAHALGPENLAHACREVNARLITISTDYVFDGHKSGFYTQKDEPKPESVYGISKLEGEQRAQAAYPRTIIVRAGFIFGPGGTNFLSTVIQRARQGQKLKAITDAYGTPTYSIDLARRLRELAELDQPGTYHVVNVGDGVSYHEFASAALNFGGYRALDLERVESASLNRPAPRPLNSRLKCLLSEQRGLSALPYWLDSLRAFAGLITREIRAGV